MNNFLQKSIGQERRLMQFYVDKHATLHVLFYFCCYLAAILVISGPFLLSIPLPTNAKYPFSLNSSVVRLIVFAHQGMVGFQVSSAMSLDCLAASLLWFIVVRFKLLAKDFQNIHNKIDFKMCVHKHQDLLRFVLNFTYNSILRLHAYKSCLNFCFRYGHEVTLAIRFLIFTTVATSTFAVVFAGIHLFSVNNFLFIHVYVYVYILYLVNFFKL